MSDNHTFSSTETAEPPIPGLLLFAPSNETPKPLGDFPTATASMYETYLGLWWARNERYNIFISLCNYFYDNTIGQSDDDYILSLIIDAVGLAYESMMEDFGEMEEGVRSGTLEDDVRDLLGVGGI